MDFVADESCAWPVVRALRDAGHDVLAIAEMAKGASDAQVLQYALNEGRVLITEDHDFGELVFSRGNSTAGVILVRIPNSARQAKVAAVLGAISQLGARLRNAFTVIEPGRVRISTRPRT